MADVKLVRMVRDGEEPTSADVHPDEVEDYKLADWRVAGAAPAEPEPVVEEVVEPPAEPDKPTRRRK